MDITEVVSANLSRWMAERLDRKTMMQVAKAAQVGFGTVQRAKNGDGNTTVKNLDLIARSFRRTAADLVTPFEDAAGDAYGCRELNI